MESFLVKSKAPTFLLRIELNGRCFLVEFPKFFRAVLFSEHSERLLLQTTVKAYCSSSSFPYILFSQPKCKEMLLFPIFFQATLRCCWKSCTGVIDSPPFAPPPGVKKIHSPTFLGGVSRSHWFFIGSATACHPTCNSSRVKSLREIYVTVVINIYELHQPYFSMAGKSYSFWSKTKQIYEFNQSLYSLVKLIDAHAQLTISHQ